MKYLLPALLSAVAVPAASAPPAAVTRASVPIPKVLRGAWAANFGAIVESCDPAFPDGFKWSITADRERFHYWEARGTPTRVRKTAPNRFVIDLAMSGEGSHWTERRTFTLAEYGRVLVVDDPVPALGLRERRYARCLKAGPPPPSAWLLSK